jgi:hypothetical protein
MLSRGPQERHAERGLFAKAVTFANQPPSRRALIMEAGLHVALARLLVWRCGQHRAIIVATRPRTQTNLVSTLVPDDAAREIQWAFARVAPLVKGSRHWCLVQTIAASRMLTRRGIRWTMRVGVRRDANALEAHAWLVCGDRIVTGGRQARTMTPLATYVST